LQQMRKYLFSKLQRSYIGENHRHLFHIFVYYLRLSLWIDVDSKQIYMKQVPVEKTWKRVSLKRWNLFCQSADLACFPEMVGAIR